jgi:protein gp37
MAIKTQIHWVDSTVNPTMGCDGCELWSDTCKTCYAGLVNRYVELPGARAARRRASRRARALSRKKGNSSQRSR